MLALSLVSACTLPRGAALRSEVLREANEEHPSFAVVPVTRADVPKIASWPPTGWHGHYHWIDHQRGPKSQVIQAGDVVDLIIWDSQDNSLLTSGEQKSVEMRGLRVSPSGTIFVPYVYDVVVRGLTPASARSRIQSKLEPIVPSAQVQLSMAAGQDNSVDLVGGVTRPGTFPLPSRNYTILSLLAQGGGISPTLENPIVRVIRGSNTYTIPAKDLFSSAAKNTTLRGNDKVLVEEDPRTFTALGATGTESLVRFPKAKLSALEAMSVIGGLSDSRANPKGILVLREYSAKQIGDGITRPPMQQVIFTLDLTSADGLFAARNFFLNPDDTVLATESPVTAARTILSLFGNVVGFGAQVSNATN